MNTDFHSRILVVAARGLLEAGLTQFLQALGYRVLSTDDVRQALDCLTQPEIHLLIADLSLDPAQVLSFLRQAWQRRPELPAIVVSDYASAGKATEALRLGAYDYVLKPIDYERLRVSLQKGLEQTERLGKSRKLAARLTAANEIWRKLPSLLDAQAISQRVVDELEQLIPCERLAFYLLDLNTGRLTMAACLGLSDEQVRRAEATAMERHPGWVVQHRQPLFVPDTRHDERVTYEGSLHHSVCVIHMPLVHESQVLGVLAVGSDQPYAFDHADLSFLESLALQISVTLENARLHRAMQRRLETLNTLQAISVTASANLQPAQVAQMAAEAMLHLSHVKLACILLRDPATGHLRLEANVARGSGSLAPIPFEVTQVDGTVPLAESSPDWLTQAVSQQKPLFLPPEQSSSGSRLAVLPLAVHENLLGILVVGLTLSQLTPGDRSLFTTSADRVTAALNNAHQRQAERRRTQELSLLVEALQSLSSTLDLDQVLQNLITTLGRYTHAPLCFLAMRDPGGDDLIVRALYSDAVDVGQRLGSRLNIQSLPKLARVLDTQTPLFVTDQGLKKPFHRWLESGCSQAVDLNSLLVTPLTRGDESLGLLGLWLYESPADPPFELTRLADSVAHYAVMAIENTRLYGAMQAEKDRAESFYEIERQLVARLDPDDLVPLVLEITQQHTQAKWGSLFLFDTAGNATYYRLSRRWLRVDQAQETVQTVMAKGAAGWTMRHKQSCLIPDTRQDPRWLRLPDDDTVSQAGSALIVPMIRDEQVIGVLTLAHPDRGHFKPAHQTWLETLASRAAVALENAQLYERVRSEQQQLNMILRSTADAVIVLDQHTRLTMANPAAERLFGLSLADQHHKSLARLLLCSNVRGDWKRLLNQRSAEPFTFNLQVGERVVRGHAAPIKGPGDEPRGWVTVLQDITDLKELDRLKSQMIQMASHDLRSPLNLAYNYHMLLSETIERPTLDQQEMLLGLERNLMRMEDLISDLLNLERIEAGIGRRIEPFDWAEMVQEVVDQVVKKPVHIISVDVLTDLPTIWGDRVQLRQALVNLVENAVKYTPDGGQITIRSQSAGKELQVEVQDDGLGIPADRLPNLFQHFYRAKQPGTEAIGGTGLGLSLVKAVIEGHSGRIWVRSQENRGSTFGFALPLNHDTSPA